MSAGTSRYRTPVGELAVRPLDVDADAETLHRWVTAPHAAFWGMQDCSVAAVRDAYRAITADPHHQAHLGLRDGVPAFLVERYDPAHRELVGLYDPQPGDVGMHFLCAPADPPVPGFTRSVIATIMQWLLDDPAVQRVVVEPDVRNTAVQRLNALVGFTVLGTVRKPEKDALLSACRRDQFRHPLTSGATP